MWFQLFTLSINDLSGFCRFEAVIDMWALSNLQPCARHGMAFVLCRLQQWHKLATFAQIATPSAYQFRKYLISVRAMYHGEIVAQTAAVAQSTHINHTYASTVQPFHLAPIMPRISINLSANCQRRTPRIICLSSYIYLETFTERHIYTLDLLMPMISFLGADSGSRCLFYCLS